MNTKLILILLVIGWHLNATAFFGWNFTPKSVEEIIVDGMAVLALCILYGKA